MTQRQFSRIALAAFALILFSGRSEAQVVQCIDEAGASTFSNIPCAAGSVDKNGTNTAAGARQLAVRRPSHGGKFATAENARIAVWANKRFPRRQLASDVATMKAAKASTVSLDEAHAQARKLKADRRKI